MYILCTSSKGYKPHPFRAYMYLVPRHNFCPGHLCHSVTVKLEQCCHFITEWSDWGERSEAIMPLRNEVKDRRRGQSCKRRELQTKLGSHKYRCTTQLCKWAGDHLHMRSKLCYQDGAQVLCNREIGCAISRLVCNIRIRECAAQSRDCANLQIAQNIQYASNKNKS